MAIKNINDLDTAEIRLTEDGSLEDLSIAIYKDDTMNFIKIDNFPIPSKYKIDKRIENIEREMTLKLKECKLIDETESDLNLSEIVELIKNIALNYETTEE